MMKKAAIFTSLLCTQASVYAERFFAVPPKERIQAALEAWWMTTMRAETNFADATQNNNLADILAAQEQISREELRDIAKQWYSSINPSSPVPHADPEIEGAQVCLPFSFFEQIQEEYDLQHALNDLLPIPLLTKKEIEDLLSQIDYPSADITTLRDKILASDKTPYDIEKILEKQPIMQQDWRDGWYHTTRKERFMFFLRKLVDQKEAAEEAAAEMDALAAAPTVEP